MAITCPNPSASNGKDAHCLRLPLARSAQVIIIVLSAVLSRDPVGDICALDCIGLSGISFLTVSESIDDTEDAGDCLENDECTLLSSVLVADDESLRI